jgi:hypothetical protein
MFRLDATLGQFRAAQFGYQKIEMTGISSNQSTVFKPTKPKPKPAPAIDKKENEKSDCDCFGFLRRKK